MPPLVSVVMPVYNVDKYLNDAIDSILNQSYKDFVFYIINDGSTDRSEDVILSYNDERIIYLKNTFNQGYIKCLNQAIDVIDSKYIIRMDSDDISLPTRIEKQLAYMEMHTNVVVCGSSRINFYPEVHRKDVFMKAITEKNKLFVNSIFNTSLHHPSVIIRTEILKNFNLRYQERYYYAEDKALWLDLAAYGDLANIEEALLRYRIHYNQVSYQYTLIQKDNSVNCSYAFLLKMGIKLNEEDKPYLLKLCYERKCENTEDIAALESLVLSIMVQAKELGLESYSELCTNLRNRFKSSILKSSRIGARILKEIYHSRLVSIKDLDLMFYVKTTVRTFVDFEIR
ncbi:glycosyltransferase family 2 protein [Anditalea andensis]|uniref:Glycosyltransferase 2-like domain-containing protein n=1 Tax=Anditalea andensis TaxID=1048983 RepID=A0A074KWK2_9BACT|nr:glycosyltransferase family 2 protein [Anditalea andensis]KEO72590.1 hypothetical protein EL17_17790 [Anditalea andensis]